jgi:hypothetical protein
MKIFCLWLLTVLCWPSLALGWSELTHQKMVENAIGSVGWLERYRDLKVTSFEAMARDVLGPAPAAAPASAFKFFGSKTRAAKREAYLESTSAISDPTVRSFARHLLLGNGFQVKYTLGEGKRTLSAREVLAGYAGEPDWGMDKGLDAARDQLLMGGKDPKMTSSQGFRHMSFLGGLLGQGPDRAQRFFDLGARAIEKGHSYWGFRFVAWGIHYLQDMGTPVHTSMLPTPKYIRLKGMLRTVDENGVKRFNRSVLKDVFVGSASINANYHFLYESFVDQAYTGDGAAAGTLERAVKGNGREEGILSRLLGARTVKGLAVRRSWSRLSTPGIVGKAIRYFTDGYRQPAPGAPSNTVGLVDEAAVDRSVALANARQPGENLRQHGARLAARDAIVARTARQFEKNGVAIRRSLGILQRSLSR